MTTFLLLAALGWIAWHLLAFLARGAWRLWQWARRPGMRQRYALAAHENAMLALAHPMAFARVEGGFADARLPVFTAGLAQSLRPALLHGLGLRADTSDAELRNGFAAQWRNRWFRMDLDALRPQDAPRDALAFACARVAFATRTAAILGWLDEATQWEILAHNAQRAGECFTGWEDYGWALARGRRQWVAHARADSLGTAFTEDDVRGWIAETRHPWRWLPWPGTAAAGAERPAQA
ncbi:DUF1266 domain-containing protein [Acidovorax sp. NCPPB 4044]|uniref:DUF1266 domain-containing protein n=1 Tax=Acidovorax sp. NCPPB 4044 TaxID=2940490 RepID=UPI002302C93F|nr:DUF1266 domain-containing protein [Acidovorax sp. NCPPB 4044]MDA8519343.1 DUF1266 domain-containing protein [Acidovorax sp. NCPPB 4044]